MLSHPTDFLARFFSIDEETIAADIARARGRVLELIEIADQMFALPFNARTPEVEANIAHHIMVMASEFLQVEQMAEEISIYYAHFGVREIADAIGSASEIKGRLGKITCSIEALNQKHGLCGLLSEDTPRDLQALHAEYERLAEGIQETVVPSLFRRYKMEKVAALYETDRADYEKLVEIGRRSVSRMPPDIEARMDQDFLATQGERAFQAMKSRVEEIKHIWRIKKG